MIEGPQNIKQVIWLIIKWSIAILVISLLIEAIHPKVKHAQFRYHYYIRR